MHYRFTRVCGVLWEDLPNSLPFFLHFCHDVFLVSLEVVNVVEVHTDEFVEVWEYLRLGPY